MVKPVANKPFSTDEMCAIIGEHDETLAAQLLEFFLKLKEEKTDVDFSPNSLVLGGTIVINLPLTYYTLRKNRFDEMIVLNFANSVIKQLPDFEVVNGKVAMVAEGSSFSPAFNNLLKNLKKEPFNHSLHMRVENFFKTDTKGFDFGTNELTALGNYFLGDFKNILTDPKYIPVYAKTVWRIKSLGFQMDSSKESVTLAMCHPNSIATQMMLLQAVIREHCTDVGVDTSDLSSIFNTHVKDFKGEFAFHPDNFHMRICMAAVGVEALSPVREYSSFVPTQKDVDSPMFNLVVSLDSDMLGQANMALHKHGCYTNYRAVSKLYRLSAVLLSRMKDSAARDTVLSVSRIFRKTIYPWARASVSQFKNIALKKDVTPTKSWRVYTKDNECLEIVLILGMDGATQSHHLSCLGIGNFLDINASVNWFQNEEGVDLLHSFSAMGIGEVMEHLGERSMCAPLPETTHDVFEAEQVYWSTVYPDNFYAVPPEPVKLGTEVIKIYNKILLSQVASDEGHVIPNLFHPGWGEAKKYDTVDAFTKVAFDLSKEASKAGELLKSTGEGMASTLKKLNHTVGVQTIPKVVPAITLSLSEAFVKAQEVKTSDEFMGLGGLIAPKSAEYYYRIIHKQELQGAPGYLAAAWSGQVLAFKVFGSLRLNRSDTLHKWCFKTKDDYCSVRLEVSDPNTVVALCNTLLGHLIDKTANPETLFLIRD